MVRPQALLPLHENRPKASKRRTPAEFTFFVNNEKNGVSMINTYTEPSSTRSMPSARNRQSVSSTRSIEHYRPRSMSTGRMRGNGIKIEEKETQSVAKTIWEIREKREKSQYKRQASKHTFPPRSSDSMFDEQAHGIKSSRSFSEIQPQYSCPPSEEIRIQQEETEQATRNLSNNATTPIRGDEDERAATLKLKEAEGKIGSLMEDLEELRFFHEIAMEPSLNVPSKLVVESPARRKNRFLSPRRLSGMDRTFLELEAQELQRKVEILQEEKDDLEEKAHIFEQHTKAHSESGIRMQSLEKSLRVIRGTILEQMREIQFGRVQLNQKFELEIHKAKSNNVELKEQKDVLTAELNKIKQNFSTVDDDFATFRERTKEKLDELQLKWMKKEETTELQLDEITNVLDETQLTLAVRDDEVEGFEKKLVKHKLEHEERKKELADMINCRNLIEALLQDRENQNKQLEEKCKENFLELEVKIKCISDFEEIIKENTVKLDLLQKKIDSKEEGQKQQLEQVRRSHDVREQRRLDELVESQHAKCTQYEERLADIRKQLTLTTDRHHIEIEQKERVLRERAEKIVFESKLAARSEYEPKLKTLREKVEALQECYDNSMQETLRKQVQAESKDRDSVREMEHRDALRKGELECINDKLNRALRDVAEKETKINNNSDRLSESEERCQLLLDDLESQHVEESKTRDDLILQRKSVSKLRSELSRKDFELAKIRDEMETEIENLRDQLEQKDKAFEDNHRKEKSFDDVEKLRVVQLHSNLENTQKELVSEKARHESLESELRVEIAKFDGKLSASESTLSEKRSLIENLEVKLLSASENSSASSKLKVTINALSNELNRCKESLSEEQALSVKKDGKIACLQRRLDISKHSEASQIITLEEELASTQTLLEQAIDPNNDEIMELREKLESTQQALTFVKNQGNLKIEELGESLSSSQGKITDLVNALKCAEDKTTELEESMILIRRNLVDAEKLKTAYMDELMNIMSGEQCHDNLQLYTCEDEIPNEVKHRLESYELRVRLLEQKLKDKQNEGLVKTLDAERSKASRKAESDTSKNEVLNLKVKLQNDSNDVEKSRMQQRVEELEDELAKLRMSNNSDKTDTQNLLEELKSDLEEKELQQQHLTQKIKAALNDRLEASKDLEHMIEEVQMRQEEYDALGNILETREEELESAKMIATKALASAQEIKTHYRERGAIESDRQTDLQLKIDELTASIEYLTSKNDKLRHRISRIEMELHERNKECAKLKDDIREYETSSKHSSSFNSALSTDKDGFIPLANLPDSKDGNISSFLLMDNGFSIPDEMCETRSHPKNTPMDNSEMENLGEATRWLQDFEDGKSAFSKDDSIASDRQKNKKGGNRDSGNIFKRKRFGKRIVGRKLNVE